MAMKTIAVLSGAGMSAESGIKTFRDAGGLWENYDILEVASIDAWRRQPELVNTFYNQRRMQLAEVNPNAGHLALAELEAHFNVQILTQNVDDLHERAGSTQILHLHGELRKIRSEQDDSDILDIAYEALTYGRKNDKGQIYRPHIVWFGEEVPMMEAAINIIEKADLLIVIGTSLEVYPAAGLIHYFKRDKPMFVVDPSRHHNLKMPNLRFIQDTAANALPALKTKLIADYI